MQLRVQSAGWSADVERWESDSESSDSDAEGDADLHGHGEEGGGAAFACVSVSDVSELIVYLGHSLNTVYIQCFQPPLQIQ